MISLFRKVRWWLHGRRKEEELREELQFHLAEEMEERRADGLPDVEAAWAARRELGNTTLLREDARTLWSWTLLEQLVQDVRYGVRGMAANRMFTGLAALSLALGIGANTAIYSFMDSILLRSLPVADPASLIVVKWQSRPVNFGRGDAFVMRSMSGRTDQDSSGKMISAIFPYPAFERLRDASLPVLSSLFAHKPAGSVNVIVKGEAELVPGQVRVRRLLQWACRRPGGGAPDPWRRRSRRRRAGRGLERGLQPAPIRRCRQRHRAGDSRERRDLHGDRRRAARVLWRRSGLGSADLSAHARQPSAGTRRRAGLSRPELLLDRDDGPAEARRRRCARPRGARGAVRAVGRLDGDQRRRARQSSRVATRGGRLGTRQPEASGTRSRSMCCWRWSG